MPKKDTAFLDALATALVQELGDFASQEQAASELRSVQALIQEDANVRDFFTQAVGTSERLETVSKALGDRLQPAVKNALLVLIREAALAELPRFIARFQDVRQRMGQSRTVVAETPQPLEPEEKKKLQSILEKKWGMKVSLEEHADPSLIGGLRLRSGDWQFDASVRGRLERLAQHLTQ